MELYTAQPKQVLFHSATAEEVLYGGSAGGGKSKAILWDAVANALKYKNARIAIFRRTYPELEKSIIFNFLKEVPQDLYEYSKKEHRAMFKETQSVIDFNHCQYEADVFKYQSVEYDYEYFDELTHFTEFIYQYLLSRLRTTNKEIHPQVKAGSNPGNVGHLWVKKRFIDGVEPYKIVDRTIEYDDVVQHFTTQFIPANLYDNFRLMENDPSYELRLKRLPEDERKALLDGNWDVFKGQFFKEWNNQHHVIAPINLPRDWKRFRSMDWGYSNPTAVLWFAVSPKKKIYLYRELYVTQTNISELATQIRQLSVYTDDYKTPERISYTVADPSMWSMNQYEKGESIAMRMAELGIPLTKADNSRLGGWSAVHDALYVDEQTHEPTLQIFDNCKNCIRTIPAQVYDQSKPEDMDTEGEDHCADALRYGIMSNPQVSRLRNSLGVATPGSFDAYFKKIKRQRGAGMYVGGGKHN